MKDGTIEILYANGNTSVNKNKRNGIWRCTNNKGYRWTRNEFTGEKLPLDSCPYTPIIDPASKSTIYIRSDNTIVVLFEDGSRYVKHSDGTVIFTNSEKTAFTVEHES